MSQDPESAAREESVPTVLAGACLAIAFAYQAFCVFRSEEFMNSFLMHVDDTYYYLVIAQNIAESGVSTLDGIHRTSGVQLLWMFFLVPLAWILKGGMALIQGVLLCCAVLNAVTGIAIFRLGTRLSSRRTGAIGMVFWAGCMISLTPMMQAMEFSVTVLVLVVTLEFWQRLPRELGPTKGRLVLPREYRLLSLLLTLVYWARLDAAFIAVFVWIAAAVPLLRSSEALSTRMRLLAQFAAIPALGALLYMYFYWLMAGWPLPVSGAVKSHYANTFFDGVADEVRRGDYWSWWLGIQASAIQKVNSASHLSSHALSRWTNLTAFAGMFMTFAAVFARGLLVGSASDRRTTRFLLGIMGIAQLHVVMMLWHLAHFGASSHYYGLLLLAWLLWTTHALSEVIVWLPRRLGNLLLLSALVMIAGFSVLTIKNQAPNRNSWWVPLEGVRTEFALWMNDNLPEDAIIGAWNAGQIAYFTDRPVVNLDGLANNRGFLEVLRADSPEAWQDYFARTGITHLVDTNTWDMSMKRDFRWNRKEDFRGVIPFAATKVLRKRDHLYVLKLQEAPSRSR